MYVFYIFKIHLIYIIIFYNVPTIFYIFHYFLQGFLLLPKQHSFSYMFTLITHNNDTPVISELKKLN